MKKYFLIMSVGLLYCIGLSWAYAHGDDDHGAIPRALFHGLETNAGRAVKQFQQTLRSGSSKAIPHFLASNATVYETGDVERTAKEYLTAHLSADIEFLAQMKITDLEHQVIEANTMAYSIARYHVQGEFKQQKIDKNLTETIVLQLIDGHWKIVHIHW